MAFKDAQDILGQGDFAIPYRKFEEYKDRFKDVFKLEKTDKGILTAKWHTDGQEMLWGQATHKAIGQLCMDVHQDPDIEVLILGGYGFNYLGESRPPKPTAKPWTPENRYDIEYYDGTRSIEALVGLEQHTIGVINGPGYHTEYAVFCDITLMADNAVICDPHFYCGHVPGDGVQIAWREAMGIKRYNYALLTNQFIDAQKALEYGLANEVVPADKIYDRAKELAELILTTPRVIRMVTTQVLRAPWRKELAWELRHAFGSECFASAAEGSTHDATPRWPEVIRNLGCKIRTEWGKKK
jgi:enoyl-CoA hydratase/carnithine racemase